MNVCSLVLRRPPWLPYPLQASVHAPLAQLHLGTGNLDRIRPFIFCAYPNASKPKALNSGIFLKNSHSMYTFESCHLKFEWQAWPFWQISDICFSCCWNERSDRKGWDHWCVYLLDLSVTWLGIFQVCFWKTGVGPLPGSASYACLSLTRWGVGMGYYIIPPYTIDRGISLWASAWWEKMILCSQL